MRLCSGAGCGRKVADDVRYCDECKKERGTSTSEIKTHTSGYTEELDDLRKGGRWQRIRQTVLHRFPVCARCNLALSDIADHIVPAGVAVQQARDSGRYPYDKYTSCVVVQCARVVQAVSWRQDAGGQGTRGTVAGRG